jgi:hypothetical protein
MSIYGQCWQMIGDEIGDEPWAAWFSDRAGCDVRRAMCTDHAEVF